MTKKQVAGAAVAIVLFIVSGFASKAFQDSVQENMQDFWNLEGSYGDLTQVIHEYPKKDFVGVINITGTIQDVGSSDLFTTVEYDHQGIMDFVEDMTYNSDNVGLFLNIDSPGGYTYEITELYEKLMNYKEVTNRPIYAYCNSYCCSGGYYLAATADEIYANQESIVGSIGCILSSYDCSGLFEKLGIKEVNIASGKNKVMGSAGTPLTEEQLGIYQSIVDESYESFVDAVQVGRNMKRDDVYKAADGRIYSAKQAKEIGLIDGISSYDNFNLYLSDCFESSEFYTFGQDAVTFYSLMFSKIKHMMPKSDVQTNLELLNKYKDGGLMYYADFS